MLVSGQNIHRRYQIEKTISKSPINSLYLAIDAETGEYVVLKEHYDPFDDPEIIRDNEQLFLNEVSLLSTLDHPGIPRILDFFLEAGRRYLITEYIEGSDLNSLRSEKGFLEQEKVLEWALQLVQVLKYLHQKKPPIIYRDIKPSNIMCDSGGKIKLIDFGIARTYKPDKHGDTFNLGSGGYAAPEQYAGAKRQTDTRTDIYSLGVTLHQLLTGFDPVKEGFRVPVPSTLAPGLNPWWDRIIMKATKIDPDERYSSVAEMEADLERLHRGEPLHAEKKETDTAIPAKPEAAPEPVPSPVTVKSPAERKTLKRILSGILSVLLVGIALIPILCAFHLAIGVVTIAGICLFLLLIFLCGYMASGIWVK